MRQRKEKRLRARATEALKPRNLESVSLHDLRGELRAARKRYHRYLRKEGIREDEYGSFSVHAGAKFTRYPENTPEGRALLRAKESLEAGESMAHAKEQTRKRSVTLSNKQKRQLEEEAEAESKKKLTFNPFHDL